MSISARNHLKGKITDIKLGDVMAHITIRVGQNVIESVITRQSADEMGLKKGDAVTAVVKATEVMVSKTSKQQTTVSRGWPAPWWLLSRIGRQRWLETARLTDWGMEFRV